MSNEKTVIDLGPYRLVKLDRYNYEMEEFRTPGSNGGKHLVKDGSPRWYRMGHYFQSVASGVSWLLDHRMLNEGGEYALEESVKRYRKIADELREYMEKAADGKNF